MFIFNIFLVIISIGEEEWRQQQKKKWRRYNQTHVSIQELIFVNYSQCIYCFFPSISRSCSLDYSSFLCLSVFSSMFLFSVLILCLQFFFCVHFLSHLMFSVSISVPLCFRLRSTKSHHHQFITYAMAVWFFSHFVGN